MKNEFDLELGVQPRPVNGCYCWGWTVLRLSGSRHPFCEPTRDHSTLQAQTPTFKAPNYVVFNTLLGCPVGSAGKRLVSVGY